MALVTDCSLFLHVPKTGGSTVRRMMVAAGIDCRETGPFEIEDHYSLPELRAAHPGVDDGRLTFGFVRHPVAWLRSRWAWAMVSGFAIKVRHEPAAAAHWMASCWSDRFDTFAEHYLDRYPGIYTQTVYRILGLWSDEPARRIGRTETLADDLIAILDEAGEVFDVAALRRVAPEKVAASGEWAVRCRLPSGTEARIIRAESALCERFGYGMGSVGKPVAA